MAIELAKIQLNRVHKIGTLEQASLVHHYVPGLEGNITQNLGRDSVSLQIEGIFYGVKANEELEKLRSAYKKREPVDFLADVVGQAYFSQVVIERFEVVQSAQIPEQFSYRLTIAEYIAPKKSPAANKAAVNQAIKKQAQSLMDIATLPDALTMGSIPELTNPAEPLNGAVAQIATAMDGITTPMDGLKALTDIQAEAVAQPLIALPPPPSLQWIKQPPAEELLKAGLPVKNLISSGVSVAALVKSGASVLELRQAGVTDEALSQAGASKAALQTTEQALKVLSVLETPPFITIEFLDEDGIPLANQDYQIQLPDGITRNSTLNAQGQALIEITAAGTCTITFPNLDSNDWELLKPPTKTPQTSWVAFSLLDEDGIPLKNETYRITLSDGNTLTGNLDAQGEVRLPGIPAGDYTLTFPNLDAGDWELVADKPATASRLAFSLLDEDGIPLKNEAYRITLSDGNTLTGNLDAQGEVRLPGIPAGDYTLTFPNLDAGDWELVAGKPATASRLAFSLLDEDGIPLKNQAYRITLTDGDTLTGNLDAQGQAEIVDIPSGDYTLTFPDLDGGDWQSLTVDTNWLAFEMVNEDGEPVGGIGYELRRDNLLIRQGFLDAQGRLYINAIEAGNYMISFPDLDANDWDERGAIS